MGFVRRWKPGDWVIYRMSKHGVAPGRRALQISATPKGESYNYVVDKFWVVESITPDGQLRLRTPGGKLHVISPESPNLRRAHWWDRLLWGERFRNADLQRRHNELLNESPHQGGPAEAA